MSKIRIFRVELEHIRYGTNWQKRDIAARTAREAMDKAERGEQALKGSKTVVRVIAVNLLAEADA